MKCWEEIGDSVSEKKTKKTEEFTELYRKNTEFYRISKLANFRYPK